MIISRVEKKMREVAAELWEGITERAEDRNIEIDSNALIDCKEIEERFAINPQQPRFSFGWARGRRGYNISKNFVSKKELERMKREFVNYVDKFEKT